MKRAGSARIYLVVAAPTLVMLVTLTGCASRKPTVDEPAPLTASLVQVGSGPAAGAAEPATAPPVEPRPSSPIDPEAVLIRDQLQNVAALADATRDRDLTREQREQLDAVDSFVLQARQALNEDDRRRAAHLADKATALVEELERASR